jgi:hypothetical protein
MITDRTFKFYWTHLNVIQQLTKEELNRYAKAISLSNLPSTPNSLISKAIRIREDELTPETTYSAIAVSSSITNID